ncbi:MAG: PQQ-dependent sugar dehydrogenase, partial [Verrucomicrobia bacterium]|nr:PQQ-dependent sugar dehydrogenase [Verrucomicrobiota bacterium]
MRFLKFLLILFVLGGTAASAIHPDFNKYQNRVSLVTDRETGLSVPDGFTVELVADLGLPLRHIVVRDNGDVFASLDRPVDGRYLVGLRDTVAPGPLDRIEFFSRVGGGTGLAIDKKFLYFSSVTTVYRVPLAKESLVPRATPEALVRYLPRQNVHAARSLAIDNKDNLYVNVGAPSNSAQKEDRKPGSPGVRPPKELKWKGSIWRFSKERLNQKFRRHGYRFATGLRNAVALDWNSMDEHLYLVMHGRDQLDTLWPEFFNMNDNAELPAEEFHRITDGSNLGWPFTYWDPFKQARVTAPEYGGDGKEQSFDPEYQSPLIAFPAHWAPNDLVFYSGDQFPQRFYGGAFIAFHGSWNRAPMEQQGYKVVFVPFEGGEPTGKWEVFADG